MAVADTAAWFAATSVSVLFWWTVVSPLLVLGAAVLAGRRPRVRYALTLAVVIGPLLELLPLAVMHGGRGGAISAVAAAVESAAAVLAVLALVALRDMSADAAGGRAARLGGAATVAAVAGGMIGSVALLTSFVFS
jgi:hypothetical protein